MSMTGAIVNALAIVAGGSVCCFSGASPSA